MMSFLLLLALFILGIAWINYINLSTARATTRAREVGVRKAIGAGRGQLFGQFLLESVLLNAVGIALAFTLVQLSLPFFRELTGLALSLTLWNDWQFWAALAVLFAVGTLLSGVYPALVLSAYQPIAVLKGKVIPKAGGISLRKSLVVLQFVASVTLLAGTFTIFRQMTFMRNQSLGVDITRCWWSKARNWSATRPRWPASGTGSKPSCRALPPSAALRPPTHCPPKGTTLLQQCSVEGVSPAKIGEGSSFPPTGKPGWTSTSCKPSGSGSWRAGISRKT
jgi:hypothetical protein